MCFIIWQARIGDFKSIDERTKELSRNLNSSKNELISFKYKQYNNLTHYNLPIHSVSEGFEHVFETYSAINSIEYDSVLKKNSTISSKISD